MDKNQLRDELARVHKKLDGLDSISGDEKSYLKKLMNDINDLLENHGEETEKRSKNIIDELKESVSEFEVKNPELSESINIIVQTLSNMGI